MPVSPSNKPIAKNLQGIESAEQHADRDPVRNVLQQAIHGIADLLHKASGSLQSCNLKNCLTASQPKNTKGLLLSLDNAVETDDFSAVKTFLDAGATVEPDLFDGASRAMKSFILFSGRLKKLYPNLQNTHDLDHLDQAILECHAKPAQYKERFMAALALLQNEIGSQSNAVAWRAAVNDGQVSIQRAILLLKPLRKISLALKDLNKVTDPGVRLVMKEIPYHPARHTKQVKINGAAKFLRSHNSIQCRHITMHRLMRQSMRPDGKFRLSESAETYSNALEASLHIPEEIDRHYVNLVTKAPELHLVDISFLGKAIARQLSDLSDAKPTKLFLIQAHNHAMSLRLHLKEFNQRPCYVLDFYDPNLSTTHVRMASDNIDTFKGLELSNLIHRNVFPTYFPNSSHLVLMTKVPDNLSEFVNNPDQADKQPRRLESLTLTGPESLIEPEAMYYLLQAGLGHEIRQLAPALFSLPYSDRMRALDARSSRDVPGLHAALQDGHASTVRVFGELLFHSQHTSYPQDLIDLVSAQRWDKVPGLYFAMQNGHYETVQEFVQLVYSLNLPLATKLSLLDPQNTKGFSGRQAAIKSGHPKVAELIEQALENLNPGGRGFKGEPGFTKIN